MKPLCIYHGSCPDGFTAAWVLHKFSKEINGSDTGWEFYPATYQTPPPDVTDRYVYILDFSYPKNVMEEIIAKARHVILIDHHKSAMEDLKDLNNSGKFFKVFDTEHSGARLAWDYFFPAKKNKIPKFILHVEDRDLWKFELPETKEIMAAIFANEYSFEYWDALPYMALERLEEDGYAILKYQEKNIKEVLAAATRKMIIGGYQVPIANIPYCWGSDAAGRLAIGHAFAGYYWDSPTRREFGLRSAKDGIDVSEIAKLYGGGGHFHAAGFKLSFDKAREFEITKE